MTDFIFELYYKGDRGDYCLGLFASFSLAKKAMRQAFFFDNREEQYYIKKRFVYGLNSELKDFVKTHFGIK